MDTTKMREGYAKWVADGRPEKPKAIKASFKSKISKLAPDWADKIWEEIKVGNRVGPHPGSPKFDEWIIGGRQPKALTIKLPVAALAITGARPASLERGITFKILRTKPAPRWLEATIPGAKIIRNEKGEIIRGQDEIKILWQLDGVEKIATHRRKELSAIAQATAAAGSELTIQYDAESISTSLRLLSKKIWPRRKHHIAGACYRELFAEKAKEAGMPAEQIAAAMGHLSTRSQQKYQRKSRAKGGVEPEENGPIFTLAIPSTPAKIAADPNVRLAEFKGEVKSKVAAKKMLDSIAPTRAT